ncbi:NAD-dependent epimerase/dehydratase family protein [Streptomyces sp. ISL-36]|uniref:NAD-dependent epimerase/dehydratase family protein n=1 Tax=Streptomyces sp. ISL-36 TaxID=2819182 RepID=UPI00203650F5|nr:NAD-dependent epimerase/dehydratase family protein [Streptomyces sp. ISL-36]
MTALIIGASGFLATELIRQARAAGHTTAATYATKPGDASQAEWYALDLRDAGRLDAVMARNRTVGGAPGASCPVASACYRG